MRLSCPRSKRMMRPVQAIAMGKHLERLLGDIAAIQNINPEFFDEQR